jgi:hypothetical protein
LVCSVLLQARLETLIYQLKTQYVEIPAVHLDRPETSEVAGVRAWVVESKEAAARVTVANMPAVATLEPIAHRQATEFLSTTPQLGVAGTENSGAVIP